MPIKVEITAEQHQKAIEGPEGMEALLVDLFAKHEQEFWGRSQSVVAIMAKEIMPLIKAIDVHLEGHPELKSLDFVGACFYCFNRMHNHPVIEVIEAAEKMVKKTEPVQDAHVEQPA